MTKLHLCKYRFGLTGTLDDLQTHKLVLEGLFGTTNKVISTKELIEKKTTDVVFVGGGTDVFGTKIGYTIG